MGPQGQGVQGPKVSYELNEWIESYCVQMFNQEHIVILLLYLQLCMFVSLNVLNSVFDSGRAGGPGRNGAKGGSWRGLSWSQSGFYIFECETECLYYVLISDDLPFNVWQGDRGSAGERGLKGFKGDMGDPGIPGQPVSDFYCVLKCENVNPVIINFKKYLVLW